MKRVLVTGGTGFVGSHLVAALRRRGLEVTALVRSPKKAAHLEELGATIAPGDVTDPSSLVAATDGQDAIFHVAGLIMARNEAEFMGCNRDGTANLLAAASRSATKPRFVLVSSLAAGGPTTPGTPLQGHEPPQPVTQYGRSKLAGEVVVRGGSLPFTIIRPPVVYGPRDREVLKLFKMARLRLAPVFGDGSQELSVVYGPDLVEGIIAAASSPVAVGRTYCPCHETPVTSGNLLRAIAAVSGRRVTLLPLPRFLARIVLGAVGGLMALFGRATLLTADKTNEFFQPAWTGDPARLTADTGWRATHDLSTGLAETGRWYRAQGWL